MGARSSSKTVAKRGSAAGDKKTRTAPSAPRAKRAAAEESEKYEQTGAPWWKRHLPI